MRAATHTLDAVLRLLYPPRCLVCGRGQEDALCPACRAGFLPLLPPFCDRCGAPVDADALACAACLAGPEPPFAWARALGRYEGPLREAVHRLKFHGKTALARPLGWLLADSLHAPSPLFPPGADGFDAVVPVPLHWTRLRRRGFNQSELLARVVAHERGWPLDVRGLRRARSTAAQSVQSSASARAANLRGAFAPRSPLAFHGQSVLLIDDVLTTTATVRAAAHALREAGAARVAVAALARGI